MKDYNNKRVEFQPVSANGGAGWLIRNGRVREEYYLKSIRNEKVRDIVAENEFHLPKGRPPRKRGREKPRAPEEACLTAIWTQDETQAMYFPTMREAQKMIEKFSILRMARATIVRG